MPKSIEITIHDNGDMEIEWQGLKAGEEVKDVAKFVTDVIGNVTETGHKHTHNITEQNKELQR